MKALKLFIFLTILGSVFLTSCSEEEYFEEIEMHMRDPKVAGPGSGSSEQPPCSDEVSIWVQGNYWSDSDNTTCFDSDPLTLEAIGFAPNDVITWDIHGAELMVSYGPTAVIDIPNSNTYLWFRATNQSGLSACRSGRVIDYGRCFFSSIDHDFCQLNPFHEDCINNGDGGME